MYGTPVHVGHDVTSYTRHVRKFEISRRAREAITFRIYVLRLFRLPRATIHLSLVAGRPLPGLLGDAPGAAARDPILGQLALPLRVRVRVSVRVRVR